MFNKVINRWWIFWVAFVKPCALALLYRGAIRGEALWLFDQGVRERRLRTQALRTQTTDGDFPSYLCPNTWWRRGMETLSQILALCEGNPLVTGGLRSFLYYWPFVRGIYRSRWIPLTKGQWYLCETLMVFSLLSAWMGCWTNTGEAGDLRCH